MCSSRAWQSISLNIDHVRAEMHLGGCKNKQAKNTSSLKRQRGRKSEREECALLTKLSVVFSFHLQTICSSLALCQLRNTITLEKKKTILWELVERVCSSKWVFHRIYVYLCLFMFVRQSCVGAHVHKAAYMNVIQGEMWEHLMYVLKVDRGPQSK